VPILAEECTTQETSRIKIGLIFLLLFLSRKKVNNTLPFQEKKQGTKDTSTFFACAKKVAKKTQPIFLPAGQAGMLNISFVELSSAKIGI